MSSPILTGGYSKVIDQEGVETTRYITEVETSDGSTFKYYNHTSRQTDARVQNSEVFTPRGFVTEAENAQLIEDKIIQAETTGVIPSPIDPIVEEKLQSNSDSVLSNIDSQAISQSEVANTRAFTGNSTEASFLREISKAINENEPDLNTDAVEDALPSDAVIRENAEGFKIRYSTLEGKESFYYFSLLPAIESTLRGNNFGQTVPEVKPGILQNTVMNIKNFGVPGADAAYQSLGVKQIIMQVVGLFVGGEGLSNPSKPDGWIYGSAGATGFARANNGAISNADRFLKDVVLSGSPVTMFIKSSDAYSTPVEVTKQCIIQGYRTFTARHDRVYFALDLLLINSVTRKIKSTILENGGERVIRSDNEETVDQASDESDTNVDLESVQDDFDSGDITIGEAAIRLGIGNPGSEPTQEQLEEAAERLGIDL